MRVGSTSPRSVHASGFAFHCLLTPRCRLDPLPVRLASALPTASFRLPVARETLAVQLTLPHVGCVEDFHLQVGAPCRAHNRERPAERGVLVTPPSPPGSAASCASHSSSSAMRRSTAGASLPWTISSRARNTRQARWNFCRSGSCRRCCRAAWRASGAFVATTCRNKKPELLRFMELQGPGDGCEAKRPA